MHALKHFGLATLTLLVAAAVTAARADAIRRYALSDFGFLNQMPVPGLTKAKPGS